MKRSLIIVTLAFVFTNGCTTYHKIAALKNENALQLLSLTEQNEIPELKLEEQAKDTLTVTDDNGKEILIMKAVRNENGEMVATDVIPAAKVTARFRNIAERGGKIDIVFNINIPKNIQDSRWQVRFQPELKIFDETLQLEPVVITGKEYRKLQLKGYQRYNRFIASIASDSTKFIEERQLEIFLKRNIPQIYKFKTDSTVISETEFSSAYGITEQTALEHYTNKFIVKRNRYKISHKDRMKNKYIKAPILSEGLRLDTVIENSNNEFVYCYVQTIKARSGLRKAEVSLSGDIYEQEQIMYHIPKSEPITFYISSLSTLIDNRKKYLTKVIERKAEVNTAYYIDFEAAGFEIIPELGNNASEIGRIKENLRTLVKNEIYDIDSIIVTASCSPEGTYNFNNLLSEKRSKAVCRYFKTFIKNYSDSLQKEQGRMINIARGYNNKEIKFISRNTPENWTMLENLVENDSTLTDRQRESFFNTIKSKEPDVRESLLRKQAYYTHLRTSLYPRLRTVRFDTYLHRKGMIKDTIHSTMIDTAYMSGIQAIRDRNYKKAIRLLSPYNDFNTAVAYCAMDYNASAMSILKNLKKNDKVEYILAILYSRQGEYSKAIKHYMNACARNKDYINRGNLDPEISAIIKKYGLHKY